jgi:hypothetical protein
MKTRLTCLALCALSALAACADLESEGLDNSSDAVAQELNAVWSNPNYGLLAPGTGHLYAELYAGGYARVDSTTGAIKWTSDAAGCARTEAYYVGNGSTIKARIPDTGLTYGTWPAGGVTSSLRTITCPAGLATVFASGGNKLVAYASASGAQRWAYTAPAGVTVNVAGVSPVVKVTLADGKIVDRQYVYVIWSQTDPTDQQFKYYLRSVNAATGVDESAQQVKVSTNGTWVFDQNLPYFVLGEKITAYSATSALRWTHTMPSDIGALQPTVDGLFARYGSVLRKLNPSTGAAVWTRTFAQPVDRAERIGAGVMYVATLDSKTFVIDTNSATGADKAPVFNRKARYVVEPLSGGHVYRITEDGAVAKIDNTNYSTVLWSTSSGRLSSEARLVAASTSGTPMKVVFVQDTAGSPSTTSIVRLDRSTGAPVSSDTVGQSGNLVGMDSARLYFNTARPQGATSGGGAVAHSKF